MCTIESNEWIAFLKNIKQAKRDLGSPEMLWYRGQPNYDHYLLPSLLRFKNGIDKEKYLYTNFRKFSDKLLKKRESEWETLFDMQHYGIPTRLLDWTESFGIALFFAAYYNIYYSGNKKTNAAIYLLDPVKLNLISGQNKTYRLPDEEKGFKYTGIYWDKKPFKANAPIAIEPIFINDRMVAQRGVFTIHDDSIDPIEKKFPEVIKKIMLPHDVISAALEFLDLANINHYSVYPDLAGIAGHLKKASGLEPRWT